MRLSLELVAAEACKVDPKKLLNKVMFVSSVYKTGWKLIFPQNIDKLLIVVVEADPSVIDFKCPKFHQSLY